MKKYSKDFGTKEKLLNYASSTYQLTRPNKVGTVMALIRECHPNSMPEWVSYYFDNAYTSSKERSKVTEHSLQELGERLYTKITEIIIPEWESAFRDISLQDCIDYIYDLTINRTYDGYLNEKLTIQDILAKDFPQVEFAESPPHLDHAGDIDYIGKIGNKSFGIQIKPITANANFANYKLTERMADSFQKFKEEYGGNVFVIFSYREKNTSYIMNQEVIKEIQAEIDRLES